MGTEGPISDADRGECRPARLVMPFWFSGKGVFLATLAAWGCAKSVLKTAIVLGSPSWALAGIATQILLSLAALALGLTAIVLRRRYNSESSVGLLVLSVLWAAVLFAAPCIVILRRVRGGA